MMIISHYPARALVLATVLLSALVLCGCASSSDNPTGMTAEQRTVATNNDNSLPAPAQGRLTEQNSQRQQTDSMRSNDAAKDRAAN